MRLIKAFSFIVLLICSFSCAQNNSRQNDLKKWFASNDKIKILTTTRMIHDLVQEIGGDKVDTLPLIIGELDPHSYQLVKGDDEKIAHADLIFFNGLNLEHGPSLKQLLYEKKNAYAIGDYLKEAHPEEVLYLGKEVDPHIWMDVSLFAKTIPVITGALSKQDPANKEFYEERASKLEEKLKELHREVKKIMHGVPEEKRYLVTSHDAFNYFARAYLATEEEVKTGSWSKRFQAPEGLAPDSQLSLQDINFIINHLRTYNIEVIFPESNVSRNSLKKIVEAIEAKGGVVRIATCSLYADAMGKEGSRGDSYLKMLRYDAELIASNLFPQKGGVLKCNE